MIRHGTGRRIWHSARMAGRYDKAKYWRDRAASMRAIAGTMSKPETAEALRRIAADHDDMAKSIEEREKMSRNPDEQGSG